jgi:hypothetical protein
MFSLTRVLSPGSGLQLSSSLVLLADGYAGDRRYIPTEWVCIIFVVFFGLSTGKSSPYARACSVSTAPRVRGWLRRATPATLSLTSFS